MALSLFIICFSILLGNSQAGVITYDTTGFSRAKLLVYPGVYKNRIINCVLRSGKDYILVKKGGNLIAEYELVDTQEHELKFACWYDSNNLRIKDSVEGEVSYFKYNEKGKLVSIDRFLSDEGYKEIIEKDVFVYNCDGGIISDSNFIYNNGCPPKVEIYRYNDNHDLLNQTALFYNKRNKLKYREIIEMNEDEGPFSRKVYRKEKLVSSINDFSSEEF